LSPPPALSLVLPLLLTEKLLGRSFFLEMECREMVELRGFVKLIEAEAEDDAYGESRERAEN
jgi:hypothetical protein